MNQTARETSSLACALPKAAEVSNLCPFRLSPPSMEHPGTDESQLSQCVDLRFLRFEGSPQFPGEQKHSHSIVLRRPRLQMHKASFEIDLLPLEVEYFAPPPSGDVGKCRDRLQVPRQAAANG